MSDDFEERLAKSARPVFDRSSVLRTELHNLGQETMRAKPHRISTRFRKPISLRPGMRCPQAERLAALSPRRVFHGERCMEFNSDSVSSHIARTPLVTTKYAARIRTPKPTTRNGSAFHRFLVSGICLSLGEPHRLCCCQRHMPHRHRRRLGQLSAMTADGARKRYVVRAPKQLDLTLS
jgi:hypothetical protein